ncbi:MAG: hypothetical protein Q7I97_07090 [Thermovirgaceae bacterium]|nr:hypothetical protein [Thermovirgaceae bacterium]
MNEDNGFPLLLEALDEKSRALFWHVWWRRHADISELRRIMNVSSDFEILFRIRDVINARAKEILGRPVLFFKESRVDPVSGRRLAFRWWFLDEIDLFGGESTVVDTFQEDGRFVVIMQVPGISRLSEASPPVVEYRNGVLKITLDKE